MRAALKTVLSALIGIRRQADHEIRRINPVHVIVAGMVLAVLFVLTLVAIVRIVTG
jgi:thiosulfate reductase cytochrome b subunit